ncbi:hypothetical protein RCOM_2098470 [Ricinus communis]|uniref:Uncharacterized protein n=1 Tax=Ricinus communis TaxID=3988 RepID=B9TBB2_RICCO|nr:hypothetical protein RCOM_2098470 [Ricinus communis]
MQLSRLPASITTEQASVHSGLQVGGNNDSMGAGFSAQSQLVNPNSRMRNDNSVGLALGTPQSYLAQGFKLLALTCSHLVSILLMTGPTTGTRELMNTLLRKRFASEVMRCLRMKICNTCFDSLPWGGIAAVNIPEGGFSFPPYIAASPMPNYDENGVRPNKAVVGWLKIKAAMRWGFFIRKKAAERQEQLVELDDE